MPDVIIQPTGTGITPQMPTAPTKEALAMTFTADPVLLGKEGDGSTILIDKQPVKEVTAGDGVQLPVKTEDKTVTTPTKIEGVDDKKVEDKPTKTSVLKPPTTDDKKVDATGKAEPKKEVVKPIIPPTAKEGADVFDYSKYSTHEQTVLKNMSRQSRDEVVKLIDQNKTLSANKDGMYYQHEQGYVLNPEFQKLQTDNYYRQTEARVWEEQLLKIRAGKPFQDIVGFDQKGNPIMSKEMPASDRDEIRVSQNLNANIQASTQLSSQLQSYPEQHKQRVNTDLQAINAERQARFSWVQDPKMLEYSVHVEGMGDRKLKDIKEDFRSLFPPYLRTSIGVEVASDMLVAMQIQAAELREARNGQQVAQIKQDELGRGEPSSDSAPAKVNGNMPKGVPAEFSLEGMPER